MSEYFKVKEVKDKRKGLVTVLEPKDNNVKDRLKEFSKRINHFSIACKEKNIPKESKRDIEMGIEKDFYKFFSYYLDRFNLKEDKTFHTCLRENKTIDMYCDIKFSYTGPIETGMAFSINNKGNLEVITDIGNHWEWERRAVLDFLKIYYMLSGNGIKFKCVDNKDVNTYSYDKLSFAPATELGRFIENYKRIINGFRKEIDILTKCKANYLDTDEKFLKNEYGEVYKKMFGDVLLNLGDLK